MKSSFESFQVSPAHALLAIVSAYYLGFRSSAYFLRTNKQKWVVLVRGLATLVLALTPLICMVTTAVIHIDVVAEHGISFYVEDAVELFCWLLHFIYVMTLLERLSPSIRGMYSYKYLFT